MRRGKLICLIGIDGSGKTTIGKLMKEAIRKNNCLVEVVYGGYDSWLLRPFIRFAMTRLIRVKLSSHSGNQGYTEYRDKLDQTVSSNLYWVKVLLNQLVLFE